jgi:hypothetical protein
MWGAVESNSTQLSVLTLLALRQNANSVLPVTLSTLTVVLGSAIDGVEMASISMLNEIHLLKSDVVYLAVYSWITSW